LTGFVVCASCGTKTKAGRAYCLRCGENLPVEGQPAKVSVWESLELSQSKVLVLLVVVAVIVLGLILVIWQNEPPRVDDLGQPGAAIRFVPPPRDVGGRINRPRGLTYDRFEPILTTGNVSHASSSLRNAPAHPCGDGDRGLA